MRQIKFRGKDLNTGEWVYGFYTQGSFIDPINGEERVRHLIEGDVLYDVDPETVGQFTGTWDLNGEEVYEGDIVMHDGNHELGLRIVAFYDQTFGIFTKDEYNDIRKGQNPWLNDYARPTCMNEWSVDGLLKVVGNIYDEDIVPELKESKDERIRKQLIAVVELYYGETDEQEKKDCLSWLEKQGEQKSCMIQWKGDNLKEVIDFTGKSKNFDKWFKSFEEYEKYVSDHNGIFKMFYEDGSHYEVPVGAWIVKTPDGYNVASKAIFIQKPAWSEEDEGLLNSFLHKLEVCNLLSNKENVWAVRKLKSLKGRVLPQPKEEWNKEDENKVADYLYCLNVGFTQAAAKERAKDICDLIRSQKQWKPSEEQMEALLKLEEMHVLEHEKNQENAHLYMMVKSIREQLLKLREE